MKYTEQRNRVHNRVREVKEEEIVAPEKFKTRIGCPLRANRDDSKNEDTGNLVQIKLRPHRRYIHERNPGGRGSSRHARIRNDREV